MPAAHRTGGGLTQRLHFDLTPCQPRIARGGVADGDFMPASRRGSCASHGGGVLDDDFIWASRGRQPCVSRGGADLMTLQVSYTFLAKIPVRLEPNFLTLS